MLANAYHSSNYYISLIYAAKLINILLVLISTTMTTEFILNTSVHPADVH